MTFKVLSIVAVVGSACSLAMAQVSERIADRVVRFHASTQARDNALPSFALENQLPALGPAPANFPLSATFSTFGDRQVAVVSVPQGTSLYGTGMVSGPLLRNGRGITCWNDDSFGYDQNDGQLYQSHPWVLGVRPDGTAFGVLADTTYRCDVDLTQVGTLGIRFAAQGPAYPVITIDADSPEAVLQKLADLTGRVPMPPKWALGWQQSRFSYANENWARFIVNTYRSKNIPLDALWFDIDYMFGYRIFSFNGSTFPNPTQLNTDLETQGCRTIWMINPGVKQSTGYSVFDAGSALSVPGGGNAWVQTSGGSAFVGNVWPGASVFPDFTNSSIRSWFASLYGPYMATGIDGVWNDMNEPALLNTTPNTMPEGNVHRPDAAFSRAGFNTHARFHNVYGMQMIRATREGIQAANPSKRPFVLTRANYLGGHRYGATWTGDNRADWNHLQMSIPMVLNLGLSGQAFSGPDIGGFIGRLDGTHYARWVGIGAFFPFARAHYEGGADKEPWNFDAATETTCRLAIERRYRLMPYFYTLFEAASRTGVPVMRPAFFADTTDSRLRAEDHAFLVGADLLVSPQAVSGRDRVPVLPNADGGKSRWRKFHFGSPNDADATNPDLPEMYIRSGSIIPTTLLRQSTAQMQATDEITLLIALDDAGVATGTLYEDAGDGYGFQSGDFLRTTYRAERTGNTVRVSVLGTEGTRVRQLRTAKVRLLLDNGQEIVAQGTDGTDLFVAIPSASDLVSQSSGLRVDGVREPGWPSLADLSLTQINPTTLGDNVGELNQLLARTTKSGVVVSITGNLPIDGTALVVFVDAQAGGQNVLNTAAVPSPPSGASALTGTTFDTGFTPDTAFWINGFGAFFYVDQISLPGAGSASKTYRGSGTLNDRNGLLVGGSNATGLQVAFDNSNAGGITGNSAANAAGAARGIEIFVPYADLGLPANPSCVPIKLAATIVRTSGEVTSQWLPPVPAGTGSLGQSPNLMSRSGDQFATIIVRAPGDFNRDGLVSIQDIFDFLNAWFAADARADFNGGGITIQDIFDYLNAWFAGCQ